jgi:outer membrane protein OmpA-like peptidoglycan-associated protein
MRILLIGLIVFVGWASMSTYIYVCKIKELCPELQTTQVAEANPDNTKSNNTTASADNVISSETSTSTEKTIPKDLVIYFAFDKSDFISGTEASKYFEESNSYILHNAEAKLNITGYADAEGTAEYNQALGLRRAQTTQMYFESMGMPASRIWIESKGEKEPAADNSTEEGRAKNRRSVVTIK